MRVLYGVAGEGMGHATRAKVVIDHLIRRGHSVKVAASNRAYRFLSAAFTDVLEIRGFRIEYVDGAMDFAKTIEANAQDSPEMLAANVAAQTEVERFAPEIVFTDFDSFAYFHAKSHGIPVVSIDNMQIMPRCEFDSFVKDLPEFKVAEAFIWLKTFRCDHYLVTTFFWPPVKPALVATTTLVPPILRDEILAANVSDGEHVIVYQTTSSDSRLLDTLDSFPTQKFIVYGLNRDEVHRNCVLKKFDAQGFVDDLASAKAVVANGGMSLMSEAVALGKPVYSVPVKHHVEQMLNADYLCALGYGMASDEFNGKALSVFLKNISLFVERLQSSAPRHDSNRLLFSMVDRLTGRIES